MFNHHAQCYICSVAIFLLYLPVAFAVLHLHLLQLWCLLLICRPECPLLCLLHVCLCSYLLFSGPYFLCGCDRTGNPLYIGLDQACIVCTCSTGGSTAWCTVATMTGLQYLCQPSLLTVCGVWLYWLPGKNSSNGIFITHAVCQVCDVIPFLCTEQAFVCKCNVVQCCVVWNIILPTAHTIPYLQNANPQDNTGVSASRYKGLHVSTEFQTCVLLDYIFALSCRSWYMPLHNHSVFTDVSFHRDFHTSVVTGENFLR